MPNPQDIFQLAQQTATQVTASPENWRRFLYTAAHNYHTTYLNQLLIHAQRPDATACATMKYWNEQAHRKVMYGSKSIIILQRHQGVPTAKRVFSMTDTVLTGDKAAAPWEVTDAIRPLLMQVNSVGSLMDRATEQVVSLSDRANRVMANSIEDSTLGWSHPEDQRFILQEVAAQSTLYMICIRLGIPVQEEDFPAFQNVTQFDTSRISLCLGGYVQAAAEPLLDELGHEVMQLARDSVAIQAEPVHNTDTQSPTQTTSREEAVTDDVHEREGLSDSEPELAESQENQPEPVRQDASGLLGTERAEPVRPDDAGGNAAAELPQDGAGCTADGGQDAARPDAESADARPQDEPAGLGADVQQPEAAGGGNDPSDAVRSITEEPAAVESEESPSAFSLPEFPAELLPSLLKADTTSRASNADILSFFSKTPLLIDRLRYIRESYKVVFTELLLEDDTRVGFYKESNGLLVWRGSYLTRSAESHLSWHSDILTRQEYCGDVVNFKTTKHFRDKHNHYVDRSQWHITENVHESIISRSDFETVQRILENAPVRRPNGDGEIHPLSGLLFCKDCGAKMHIRIDYRNGGKRHVAFCSEYHKGKAKNPKCHSPHIMDADLLMQTIAEVLKKIED